jgi:hypothetical protein
MKAFIFTGPTLSIDDARGEFDAIYLPPVAQGDVYRAALKEPRAIGIIDGYFDRVPSVWHKEILWALSRGILVFGSASMGALRAAELAPFGMIGVGRIFEAYRDGAIDADDEVALEHGPAEFGFRPLSEPLVNIRQTLQRAAEAHVIQMQTRENLVEIARSLFYPKRAYAALLAIGAERGLPASEVNALRDWLTLNKVNQKRDDAIQMLRKMRDCLGTERSVGAVNFVFERTALWEELARGAGILNPHGEKGAETLALDILVEELQLVPDAWHRHRTAAMTRLLLIEEAQRHGVHVDEDSLVEAVLEFRRKLGLLEPHQLERWVDDNQLDKSGFVRLIERETLRRWSETLLQTETLASLPDELRIADAYRSLYRRAIDKRDVLVRLGLEAPSLADAGIEETDLWRWYFKEHHASEYIHEKIAEVWPQLGFADLHTFRQAVLREYLYTNHQTSEKTGVPERVQ